MTIGTWWDFGSANASKHLRHNQLWTKMRKTKLQQAKRMCALRGQLGDVLQKLRWQLSLQCQGHFF